MDGKSGASAATGASLRLQVPPDPSFSRYVRERVVGFAAAQTVPEADAAEFVAAVSEALANAIEHSRSTEPIEVHCWFEDDHLIATVVDSGIGFPAVPVTEPPLPPVFSERGRGLPIMKRYTDIFDLRSEPGKGTSVKLGRQVRRALERGERGGERDGGSGHQFGQPAPHRELHEPE